MNETWKDIPGYVGHYQVSDKGRVRSMKRGKILKSYLVKGYELLDLCKGGVKTKKSVHQLVAMAFLGHKPNGHILVVDHINGLKNDNTLSNLQIISQRQNCVKNNVESTSKYKGVSWSKTRRKWVAQIYQNGKQVNIGRFKCELAAAFAYNKHLKSIS